jgi:hypothetical protein
VPRTSVGVIFTSDDNMEYTKAVGNACAIVKMIYIAADDPPNIWTPVLKGAVAARDNGRAFAAAPLTSAIGCCNDIQPAITQSFSYKDKMKKKRCFKLLIALVAVFRCVLWYCWTVV